MSSFLSKSRARAAALALGVGITGSLAMAPASQAFPPFSPPAGSPPAGANCAPADGKISGRGSTLQTWLQYDLMGAFASDVCGSVASQGSNDITDPGSAISTLSGGTTFAQNWMTAYNYPSAQGLGSGGSNAAIGSGAGQTAIGCFAEAFAGTDIPVTSGQIQNIDGGTYGGSYPNQTSNGKNCNPSNGSPLVSPFTPAATFPNAGDAASLSPSGIMVVPVGISAVSVFANLPTACLSNGFNSVKLSNSDMLNIWGGNYTNWDQVTDAGFVAGSPCTTAGGGLAITRVTRNDNSGTTQSVDNYLFDISYPTTGTGICTGNTNTATAGNWKLVQNNEVTNTTNVNWPSGGNCSTLTNSGAPGGQSLITYVENNAGTIGYADLSDAQNDTNGFRSLLANHTIAEFSLPASNSSTNYQSPRSVNASNCTTTEGAPSGGTQAVGLGEENNGTFTNGGGYWDLTAESTPNSGPDDIAYAREGSTYPVCSLTWDMVWSNEEGNVSNGYGPTPDPASNVAANATTISLDPTQLAGLPNVWTSAASGSQQVTVTGTGGTDVLSWTGFNRSTDTLTGVSGVTYPIMAGTTFTFPNGTGGPEANLTADQRRTLYSYFTYLTSPAAQNTESSAGYAPLPAAWLNQIRSGFQANF